MMDGATGRSRGFAFVNFQDEETRTMVCQTAHEVDGVPITVRAYTAKGPAGGGGGKGFGKAGGFGAKGGAGAAPNQALAQAQEAIASLTGLLSGLAGGGGAARTLLGSPQIAGILNKANQLSAGPAPQFGGGKGGGAGTGHKIFVGGLSQGTTKESLSAYFSQFGPAQGIVMMDGQTGRSRGFGFVDFQDEATLQSVCQYQHVVDGSQVSVSAHKGGGKRSSPY